MLLAGRTHCRGGVTGYHGITRPAQVSAGCLFHDLSPLVNKKSANLSATWERADCAGESASLKDGINPQTTTSHVPIGGQQRITIEATKFHAHDTVSQSWERGL